jgi:hypothetical protein
MTGNRYLLDTNAVIALLQGNQQVLQLLQNSDWIGVSIGDGCNFFALRAIAP